MDQLSEFVVNHWILVTSFFVVLGLLISNLISSVNGIGPQAAVTLMNRGSAVAVDIRPKSDFESGHIINSLHVPLEEFPQAMTKLEKYKDRPLLVYCAVGNSSGRAVRELRNSGFSKTHALKGGFNAWRGDNLPITGVNG